MKAENIKVMPLIVADMLLPSGLLPSAHRVDALMLL